jgi:hypothetical protein
MEVSGELHAPAALSRGERAHVTTGQGLDGTKIWSGRCAEIKISYS